MKKGLLKIITMLQDSRLDTQKKKKERGKTHLHKSIYLYTYIHFWRDMARRAVWEHTEQLHFNKRKEMSTPTRSKTKQNKSYSSTLNWTRPWDSVKSRCSHFPWKQKSVSKRSGVRGVVSSRILTLFDLNVVSVQKQSKEEFGNNSTWSLTVVWRCTIYLTTNPYT